MPAVSVIMAVHNGAKYLPPAVRSILNQSLQDFEFIIIDDGSTDGSTPRILQEFACRDSRIRLITRPNRGLTRSLNEALSLASGQWIARMDADDISLPARLELQLDYMRRNPQVVLLGGAYELIDEAGRRIRVWRPAEDDATLQRQCLEGTTPICHPLAMMRADAVRSVGGYDESFEAAQDLDLWLRLGEVGQLACLPDLLLQYRQHAGSVSEARRAVQMANMRRACENAWNRRGVAGQFQFRGDDGWRPGDDRQSRFRFALQYGWWAWQAGHRATAWHYAWRAARAIPWRADAWKLAYCACFRRPQTPDAADPTIGSLSRAADPPHPVL